MVRPVRRSVFFALAALVCLPACDDDAIARFFVALDANPGLVDLGAVPLEVLATGDFGVTNTGDAVARDVAVAFVGDPGPFTIRRANSDPLTPSAVLPIEVEARPTALGIHRAVVQVSAAEIRTTVTLQVEGLPQPDCSDDNSCTLDRFDPETNRCVQDFEEGSSCESSDRCVVEPTCFQGVCIGDSKICDDQSPCTTDRCRQVDGVCVFTPDDSACDDDNPCTADSCSAAGCLNEPVANGLPCDDNDSCTDNDTCVQGACTGRIVGEGDACDDGNSCTAGDICTAGVCAGTSIITDADEGDTLFEVGLVDWPGAFLHRREVSMSDDGVFFALDHLPIGNDVSLTHVVNTVIQCGDPLYEFSYRPPDGPVLVRYVRREMQVDQDGSLRIVVGIRQLPEDGFEPQTTSYLLDADGAVVQSSLREEGGETGRSLLPDGSHVFGVVWPVTDHIPTAGEPSEQNLVVVRSDRTGHALWRHERSSFEWAEFLGVAGPRVLFWSEFRFGALDFNTGSTVWTAPTTFIAKEMALSTELNLGVTRVGVTRSNSQILGVDVLRGHQRFLWPANEDPGITIRTDPIIAPDGRIMMLVEQSLGEDGFDANGLAWIQLEADGEFLRATQLWFPGEHLLPFLLPREDDSYPTVADDGVSYVGFGHQFWAIDPDGGIRWTTTSSIPDAFTGSVPILRDDGVVLVTRGDRTVMGIRSNDGRLPETGWPTFRHDARRTNFTP